MARRILIIGVSGGTHYNEILSGALMGYFSTRNMGEMTYVGQARSMQNGYFGKIKRTRMTLSDFPWETLPEYDVLISLGQTGLYSITINDKGLREFTFPPSPDNMTGEQVKSVTEFVRKGKGCVAIHTACLRFNKEFNDMIGGSFVTHGPILEFTIEIEDHQHPITQGLESFKTVDELFFTEHDIHAIHALLSASYEGKRSPMAWVKSYGEGRVAYIAPGHDLRTFLNPSFLRLVERSTLWATRDI
jgi:type 1 glutamine amidotransferase